MTDVFIQTDANSTYQGNGGFICLNELGRQLTRMGYQVAWFDHADRLHPAMWRWTAYPAPSCVPFRAAVDHTAPIITTWLYAWMDTVTAYPALWDRLRYWCSGELLRAEPRYDESRAFVRDYIKSIAINNWDLRPAYEALGIYAAWNWTNWIRYEFDTAPEFRQWGAIGFQPDGRDTDTTKRLIDHFGANNVLLCTGTQPEVWRKMRLCDLYLAWNNYWPMVCGPGESFGLNTYEAMASGCVVVSRRHCGNEGLQGIVGRPDTLDDAIALLEQYRADAMLREHARRLQSDTIAQRFRMDFARQAALRGYIGVLAHV